MIFKSKRKIKWSKNIWSKLKHASVCFLQGLNSALSSVHGLNMPIFPNLVKLVIAFQYSYYWNLMSVLLNNMPNLEHITFSEVSLFFPRTLFTKLTSKRVICWILRSNQWLFVLLFHFDLEGFWIWVLKLIALMLRICFSVWSHYMPIKRSSNQFWMVN